MATITCSSQTILAHFMLILFTVLCLQANCSEAQSGQLPKEEVDALRKVADELGMGKSDWNFSLNPCNYSWDYSQPSLYYRSIICNCDPGGVCHVEEILVRGHDLAGVLPPSLAKLQYLKKIDFTRNYLSGTIPKEWVFRYLEYLSVAVNRLSGPIPNYLGSMETLRYVNLENNMFNGTIPAALGRLANLEILILNANSLTGRLPVELYNLTELRDIRLSSNNFIGKIPDLYKWKNLQILELQASGFEGPIPSNISTLNYITELRISDLNGSASDFPMLRDMTYLKKLMLRSCNLSGKIPDYLAEMTELKHLDLSFNNLEGGVPNLEDNDLLEVMYLTANSLSGPIPEWIKNRDYEYTIDLSYNKFSENSVPETCGETLNLYRSFHRRNYSELAKCLKGCSKDYYSVHINCGGKATKVGKRYFEADEESIGPAKFVQTYENWGASNTGDFWGIYGTANSYTANNVSVLSVNDSELYMTARLSPLSLTYYARCLANGNYTVTLYFAEIVLRDDQSFRSLGRRMFDIYIQDERKLKDFDIENEAHGVDKAVNRTFKAVVKSKTLEIRLQYAGKGSTLVPKRGTYGPLISAISVESGTLIHL